MGDMKPIIRKKYTLLTYNMTYCLTDYLFIELYTYCIRTYNCSDSTVRNSAVQENPLLRQFITVDEVVAIEQCSTAGAPLLFWPCHIIHSHGPPWNKKESSCRRRLRATRHTTMTLCYVFYSLILMVPMHLRH